eukprot:756568-Hanusia_phi.AAC.1
MKAESGDEDGDDCDGGNGEDGGGGGGGDDDGAPGEDLWSETRSMNERMGINSLVLAVLCRRWRDGIQCRSTSTRMGRSRKGQRQEQEQEQEQRRSACAGGAYYQDRHTFRERVVPWENTT